MPRPQVADEFAQAVIERDHAEAYALDKRTSGTHEP
jgi:hypothetical protein